ncbi:site-specific integrase [Burkholderia sp. BE17]|uniref:site-specific integrase n=1 Tax=Burkholderia sp. BE17 TaxID=2656644 RepID=UPI00128BBCA7|nr:site-specific integrase [Burkholderia sp. BE17]MPV64610.1 tyrosine-type recombinase/integrase [Burkholderia sp. BE17]
MKKPALSSINTDVINGTVRFRADMPIFDGKFGDPVWPFRDPDSERYTGPTSSSIVWQDFIHGRGTTFGHAASKSSSKYDLCLTPEIVEDLKIAAVIQAKFPKLLARSRAPSGKLKPITVYGRISDLANFLSHLISGNKNEGDTKIVNLSDIPFSTLKKSISTFRGSKQGLQRALGLISDTVVQQNLSAPLQWTKLDLKDRSIRWPAAPDYKGIDTLRDEQFLFLMASCKSAIANFKSALGLPIYDKDCQVIAQASKWSNSEGAAEAINGFYDSYLWEAEKFYKEYQYSRNEIKDVIDFGHVASIAILLVLTGVRRSETSYMKRDCLEFQLGYWFLLSKVVKNRPEETPIIDGWLAIDLTRDAYDILMFITGKTGNNYLISSPSLGRGRQGKRAYAEGTLAQRISKWIKKIDTEGVFDNWLFSVHQLRETLAAQLANQEVGLPFISMQLKHFHSQFTTMPNAVTAGYGQIRKRLTTSVTNRLATSRHESLASVLAEDAKFAGGGGEAHKARIDAFFNGMALFGKEREAYIKELARTGVTLMPTSIGHCDKNFLELADNENPPCYGDHRCDPDCSSHVITARSASILKMRREAALNEAQLETRQSHKVIWLGLVEQLDKHLSKLDSGVSHD